MGIGKSGYNLSRRYFSFHYIGNLTLDSFPTPRVKASDQRGFSVCLLPSSSFSSPFPIHRDKHFRIALTHFNIQRGRVEIDRTCYRLATGEKSDVARIKSAENGIKEPNESFPSSLPLFLFVRYRACRFADRFELTRSFDRVEPRLQHPPPCESLPL